MADKPAVNPNRPVSVLTPSGLVSILMPCCGMVEYTKLSVPSVLRFSRDPFELIFLDIGSLDGTADYLAGIKDAAGIRVEIVHTPTDAGIPDVVKEAISLARGEYLVLLNNDTVVTDSWLNQMIALAGMSPGIGMVGPMSNYAAPPQLVERIPYRFGPRKTPKGRKMMLPQPSDLLDTSVVHQFAAELREQNKGKWLETERLGGFCLMLKRQAYERMQGLEQFTDLSLFDTDILSAKCRQEGLNLAVCRDLFIHHFGTRTFAHGAPKESQPRGPASSLL